MERLSLILPPAPVARSRRSRRAFTLTEILVVIAIIVILATLALPAFNVMTGARSVEGATNIVASSLARARSEAISRGQPVGLAVYFDAQQQRTALALVGNAQPWTSGTSYLVGDYVYTVEGGVVRYWLCATAHTSNPAAASSDSAPLNAAPQNWIQVNSTNFPPGSINYPPYAGFADSYVSILPESEVTYLPIGIGAQVLNSARTRPNPVVGVSLDRYLRASVIFFDGDGRLLPGKQWGVMYRPAPPLNRSSRLGTAIAPGAGAAAFSATNTWNLDPQDTTENAKLTGGLGVMIYDRLNFENQAKAATDSQVTDTGGASHATSEAPSENWLDANGTLVLLNRYTGSILKAE